MSRIMLCLHLKDVKMSFEDLLRKHVGEAGRYQILITIAICIILTPDSFSSMELVFTTIAPEFWPQG